MKNLFTIDSDRRNSDSEKWNTYAKDVIPMWVADSDYASPPEVITAIQERLKHPVLGYGEESSLLRQQIVERMQRLYNWRIEADWICFTPGVVGSLNTCRAIMGPVGSHAITALPVYPHLQNASPILERPMQFYHMVNDQGRYTPDFKELENTIDETTKLLLLCNPHNPVGTIYSDAELSKFAEIAINNDLIICSDDIHADFPLYEDIPYRPIASLSPEISARTITLMAASKTFNIAGLNCSYAIIENPELRQKFKTQVKGLVGCVNILGFVASEAAYAHGEQWLREQIIHLRNNAEYCYERINAMPGVHMNKMEATFLAWVDATALQEKVRMKGFASVHDYFVTYGVAVSDGSDFGDANFFRINLATSSDLLREGLARIEQAITELN